MKLRHIVIALLISLPFFVRDYTPANELKYISIAQEALDSGSWFAFYNHGVAYADKPPLYLWIVMLAKWLFGEHCMWFIGLFSVLPFVGIMAIMGRWLRMDGVTASHTADVMFATTGMALGAAMVLRMDMLMALFITLSLYTFFRMYKGVARPMERWLLVVWIFLAVFTKGPYGVMIPVVSIVVFLAWKRELRTIGRYLGWRQLLLLVALCAAWWGAVYVEGGKEYISNLLVKQTVGRGVSSFHHKAPVWYYLLRLPMVMAPWSLLYIALIATGVWNKAVKTDTERFFIAMIVSTTIMLSCISAKLDVYLIPIYPFVAYLCAMWLSRYEKLWYVRLTTAIPALIFSLALGVTPFALNHIGKSDLSALSLIGIYGMATILSAGGIRALLLSWRGETSRSIESVAWSLVIAVAVATLAIPSFNDQIGFKPLCDEAQRLDVEDYAYYAGFRYAENMDVYLGKQLREVASIEELSTIDSPTALMIERRCVRHDETLAEWMADRMADVEVGKYKIIILGKQKDRENE